MPSSTMQYMSSANNNLGFTNVIILHHIKKEYKFTNKVSRINQSWLVYALRSKCLYASNFTLPLRRSCAIHFMALTSLLTYHEQ